MSASAFTFYRGAAAIMAADLAATPVSGLTAQLCGDAHLSNLGVFASPERQLLFDLNDFDETLRRPVGVGPEAAGDQFRDRRPRQRLPDGKSRDAAEVCARSYREAMRSFADVRPPGHVVRPRER